MKLMLKRFLVAFLTIITLTTGMLATIIVIAAPLKFWWIWIPCAVISYAVFEPVITNWRETYNNLLGLDDNFEDNN